MKTKRQCQALRRALIAATTATLFLSGCVSRPVKPQTQSFDGRWKVLWCHKDRPDLECGGFWLTLIQRGNQLCGTHGAARINLAQVDNVDGASVNGTVVGSVARLTIESGQSGGIYSAVATLDRGSMHWRLGEPVAPPVYDVPIFLADDEVLQHDLDASEETYERARRVCAAAFSVAPTQSDSP